MFEKEAEEAGNEKIKENILAAKREEEKNKES